MPINPDDCEEHTRESLELAQMITKETGIKVINLTDLLNSQHFYDAVHANREGAKIISAQIAKSLASTTYL
jgi:hypothetical protein